MTSIIRTVLFWAHLTCGAIAGSVVLMLSVTGVLLTYERQMTDWADQQHYFSQPVTAEQDRLSLDILLAKAQSTDFQPDTITLSANPNAAVKFQAGRGKVQYVNPYNGEVLPEGNQSLDEFFQVVTQLHRWFNFSGENRALGKSITGASNLVFLFIVLSGIYLWLPKVFNWAYFRRRLWFRNAKTTPARDFNWHHVFGIWAAIPLTIVISTAAVFSFSWANSLVYQLAGEEVPVRRPGPQEKKKDARTVQPRTGLPLEVLTEHAIQTFEQRQIARWNRVTLSLGEYNAASIGFNFDQGTGGEPQKRQSLSLDTQSAELVSYTPFESQPKGRQLRNWVRFLHTGEALGLIGQTIAGLASLASVFLVWTGLSLAFRRLRRYLNKRRRFDTLAQLKRFSTESHN